MSFHTARVLARHAARRRYLPEMLRKLALRVLERHGSAERAKILAWLEQHAQDPAALARQLSHEIWEEAEQFHRDFADAAALRLDRLRAQGVELGGGGDDRLLYFLVRLTRPETVVETGVAAGWSSAAVLTALDRNGRGQLWSSDLPYFRLDQPERFVGVLVDDHLRDRWHLLLDGDRRNLPRIVNMVDRIELVHYDSDKSYAGRRWAMRALTPRLSGHALVMVDDVQDDWFLRDYGAASQNGPLVFPCRGKWVGLVTPSNPSGEHRLGALGLWPDKEG